MEESQNIRCTKVGYHKTTTVLTSTFKLLHVKALKFYGKVIAIIGISSKDRNF